MKIAIISDLHLGFRQYGKQEREQDIYNQFQNVCQKINNENVDTVVIAGDLFHTANPTPRAINEYKKGIETLTAQHIVTIKGNHTMTHYKNHFSIDEFFNNPPVYYYLDDDTVNLDGVVFDGLTYRNNMNLDKLIETQNNIAEEKTDAEYRILILHQAFQEYCGYTGEKLSIEDIDLSVYDAVICGHIHNRQIAKIQDDCWFIQTGSIERLNTTEAMDEAVNGKGFHILNTETNTVEFHRVKCQRLFLQGNIEINNLDELYLHLEQLDNEIKQLPLPPVICYQYHLNEDIPKPHKIIKRVTGLINHSTIHYPENLTITSFEGWKDQTPTVEVLIRELGKEKGLTDKEIEFGVNCLWELKNVPTRYHLKKGRKGIKARELIHGNYRDNYDTTKDLVVEPFYDPEIEEYERFFEQLGEKVVMND